ncbi:hypothetical protein QVD17_17233 [Tagetes erecta]|uniref:Uncharacterized protein n=1 Tax=Tagetes erecta TaxID=13708 RepID=A0AAD8NU59_TARER|nr:hypothetical protein QVD17_17233 [Tagetes erecta]
MTSIQLLLGPLEGLGDWLAAGTTTSSKKAKDPVDKRRLWQELLHLMALSDGIWVLMGDFNALRDPRERSTISSSDISMIDFNDFIEKAGLIEYQMGVSESFFNLWPLASVSSLPRKWSDHNPIILITRELDYGPSPFKIYDSWLLDSSLINVVTNSWASSHVNGAADFVLARKLKYLKQNIKEWHNSRSREVRDIISDLESKILLFENLAAQNRISSVDLEVWRSAKKSLIEMDNKKKADLRQKSRIKWMIDGDENSSFFHGIINGNKKRNKIHGIDINGRWEVEPALVKKEIHSIFKAKFSEAHPSRPTLFNPNFNRLSHEASELLRKQVGNGYDTLFWKMPWFGLVPLKAIFHDLYVRDKSKDALVSQRMKREIDGSVTFSWDWKSAILKPSIIQDLGDLEDCLREYPFKDGDDCWIWHGDNSGLFSTWSFKFYVMNFNPLTCTLYELLQPPQLKQLMPSIRMQNDQYGNPLQHEGRPSRVDHQRWLSHRRCKVIDMHYYFRDTTSVGFGGVGVCLKDCGATYVVFK